MNVVALLTGIAGILGALAAVIRAEGARNWAADTEAALNAHLAHEAGDSSSTTGQVKPDAPLP